MHPSSGLIGSQPREDGASCPPNIGDRFDSGNKHNMRSLMEHIEQAMREMIKLAEATLDDPLDQQAMQSRVRWTAAVDIGLVARVFAVQKTTEGKTVGEQGDDLLDECAKFLAHRVREVMQMRCQGAISAVAEIDTKIPNCTSVEGQPTSAPSVQVHSGP